MKKWIGTSWKMNKLRSDAVEFAEILAAVQINSVQPFVIPPFPYIAEVANILNNTNVKIGAQNMHWDDAGAWTGEVSPAMVKDCGATLVELGHSERRTYFNETDETIALKVQSAQKHGLTPLVCIGDTKAEYDAGHTREAIERQVRAALSHAKEGVIFAYEPIWSIGVGGTPASPEFANAQHAHIKNISMGARVLYGGSVNLTNAKSLATQPNIDGLFIGRAAWDAHEYLKIIGAVS
jgi:L-erythrulose 1-phosphate isomerase